MSTGTPTAGHCPACDRYIGPTHDCPYCDARLPAHPVTRALRILALALTLCGLAALLLMTHCSDPAEVAIGDISPTMNFAFISTSGTVVRSATPSRGGEHVDYIAFDLEANGSSLRVCAYDDIAAQLSATRELPVRGEAVRVRGNLRLAADRRPRLVLRRVVDLQRKSNKGAAQ